MDRLELWYKDMVRPDPAPEARGSSIVEGDTFFKDLLRYPLAREGVYAPVRPTLLAHSMQRVGYIVGLMAYG